MARRKPTFAQARLQLQLYDLRREAKLREAREWFLKNYFVETAEDYQRIVPPGSQEDAYVRMVTSYWEQASQMLRYGLLHEDLFFQTTNEFFFVWERLKPLAAQWREMMRNPHMAENLEWAATRYEKWAERLAPGFLSAVRQYVSQAAKT
jgi:hypothetical protein